MDAADEARATAAAISTASEHGLATVDTIVLQSSNKLALRLLPSDVVARVAPVGLEVAHFEVEIASRLASTTSPVAMLDPRLAPRAYERDGFVLTFWRYYETASPDPVSPAAYADALARMHEGMRSIDVAAPHFTDRVADAQRLVASRDRTPALAADDRELLATTLRVLRRTIADRGAAEQLLHGEPHPGNVLNANDGPRFIDLETCCRGPIEFDVAHVPSAVAALHPTGARQLLDACRQLVLGMVAAWRWDVDDQFPDGARWGRALVQLLRAGPPWPALGDLRDVADAEARTSA